MQWRLWAAGAVAIGMTLGAQAHGQAKGGQLSEPQANQSGPMQGHPMNRSKDQFQMKAHEGRNSYFAGQVKVANGAFPWDPVPIVVTCNGETRYRTQADAKGRFMIRNGEGFSDTKANSGPGSETVSSLTGCNVQAMVPGFQSSTLHIPSQGAMSSPDIGTITLTSANGSAGSSVSATTASAPKDALKEFNKAHSEWLRQDPNNTERDLKKAVKIDPQFAEAWYQLGKIQHTKKHDDKALESFQKAVAADPKYVPPYELIAEIEGKKQKWPEVQKASETALTLDPAGTPQLYYWAALSEYHDGKVDEAEANARKSIAIDPNHLAPNTEQLLAVILAQKGQLAEALKHLENSLTYLKPGTNRTLVEQQITQLKKAMPAGAAQ